MSSQQRQTRSRVAGVTIGASAFRLRATVPSRMKIVMPSRSFSRASSALMHS